MITNAGVLTQVRYLHTCTLAHLQTGILALLHTRTNPPGMKKATIY